MSLSFLKLIVLIVVITSEVCGISELLDGDSLKKMTEDGRMIFPELSEKYGHPSTEYEVETKDGYLLTLYHQPGDVTRPILLIHGNTLSGDCWVVRGNDSLSITLANLGYDVWTMNVRGTRYSRKHKTLDPDIDTFKFFNYSFYESAIYDMPAVIDHILEVTGQDQLTTIAHSVGTTLIYVLGAEKPEYNEKIKLAVSLAPISFIQHFRGYLALAPLIFPMLDILKEIHREEVFSYHEFGALVRLVCLQPFGYDLCIKGILLPIFGYNEDGFERGFENTLAGHYPAGSTRKTYAHLAQIVSSNRFAKFDYGSEVNLMEYGTVEPPEFDLSKVTMKSALFVGNNDYLATVLDAERLNASLPNVVHYEVLPYEKFAHGDFIWGRRMSELFYPYLFDVLNKYV